MSKRKKRAVIIGVANNKGGVGKTVTSVCLADVLGNVLGHKVCLIDADEQSNVRTMLGIKTMNIEAGLAAILNDGLDPSSLATKVRPNVDVILSGGRHMRDFERKFSSAERTETTRMEQQLDSFLQDYDFAVIDCPPSLGGVVTNVVAFADYLVIPCAPDLLSLVGVKNTINFLDLLEPHLNTNGISTAKVAGIIPTMHESRRNIDRGILDDLHQLAGTGYLRGAIVFDPIKNETKVKTTQFRKRFLSEAFPKAEAFLAYKKAAQELLEIVQSDAKPNTQRAHVEVSRPAAEA